MNTKFKLAFTFFMVFSTICSYGQFKKITFGQKSPIDKQKINFNFPKDYLPSKESVMQEDLTFNNIVFTGFTTSKSGLKPGHLNDRNVPAYIEGFLPSTGKRGLTPENLAFEYLEAAAPLMKITKPADAFEISKVETDDLDMTHVRMQQLVKGIPVFGAEIIIHGKRNKFNFLNGAYYPDFTFESVIPQINQSQAYESVSHVEGKKVTYENEISFAGNMTSTSDLVIYPFENKFYLAYHVTSYKNIIERWEYFVDAHIGKVLHKYQSICKLHHHHHESGTMCEKNDYILLDGKATANALDLFTINRSINTYQVSNKYYLIDGSRDIFNSKANQLPNDPSGVIWTIDAFNTSPSKSNFKYDHVTSANNIWSNKTAVSSHYNGGLAFEYYSKSHNRKSINGSGGNIVSIINVADDNGASMGNAFWNGQAMFYGNGDSDFLPLARGLDVAGHEMTHGVVESSANLNYEGESGALNESFADVFGVMIDRDDWKIGEDVVKLSAFPSGALRSMEDPHNGANTNNYNAGWQPKHYNERYKGSEDNGGVHINSGIPNHAFFKFATAVGKDKAEKVYYRALTNYLTKSSTFVDCRVAVIKATTDLYGTTEINAAKKAFDDVGVIGDKAGNYETNVETNPGQEFIISTGPNNTGLFLLDNTGKEVSKLSSKQLINKPSITDDGSLIVYVADDKKLYYAQINWQAGTFKADLSLDNNPIWRSVIISKDGLRIAALYDQENNLIYVYDVISNTDNEFELYNPTYSTGVSTGDVNFADAMEFDISGQSIMYDAENEIQSTGTSKIKYWDISFIKVWNSTSGTFSLGKVSKLFTSLPKDVSVGNPTFSKNSPYIIALDYIDENGDVSILGANTESGDVKLIFENNDLGYPNYSSKDNKLVFDNKGTSAINLGIANLKTNKIEAAGSATLLTTGKRWAVWFSNGKRVLSATEEEGVPPHDNIKLASNPVTDRLDFTLANQSEKPVDVEITNMSGLTVIKLMQVSGPRFSVSTNHILSGQYALSVLMPDGKKNTIMFIKH